MVALSIYIVTNLRKYRGDEFLVGAEGGKIHEISEQDHSDVILSTFHEVEEDREHQRTGGREGGREGGVGHLSVDSYLLLTGLHLGARGLCPL